MPVFNLGCKPVLIPTLVFNNLLVNELTVSNNLLVLSSLTEMCSMAHLWKSDVHKTVSRLSSTFPNIVKLLKKSFSVRFQFLVKSR